MIKLNTPLSNKDINSLHAGDQVLLSGTVYSARDAAHQKIINLLHSDQPLPLPLYKAVIFYMGPSPAPPQHVIGAAGPTTSYRMDSFACELMKAGCNAMIGKGPRNPDVIKCLNTYTAVYFAATGGAAALLAQSITKADVIAFPELGAEAIRKLEIHNMPLIVASDCHGGDIYVSGKALYRSI